MIGNDNSNGLLVTTGVIGLVAEVLVGWGEFLLNFDSLARYSELNYDFMLGTTESSFSRGHFIGVLAAPLYLVQVNLKDKSRAFLSQGASNNFLKVKLPDTVTSIGATVTVTRDDGSKLYKPFISGEGLSSDQSHVLIFGLGDGHAKAVEVGYLGGPPMVQRGDFVNTQLIF